MFIFPHPFHHMSYEGEAGGSLLLSEPEDPANRINFSEIPSLATGLLSRVLEPDRGRFSSPTLMTLGLAFPACHS